MTYKCAYSLYRLNYSRMLFNNFASVKKTHKTEFSN